MASTELARRAVEVCDVRRIQSLRGAVTRSGQSARARRCASPGLARWRTDGRGGTGFPDTMSAITMDWPSTTQTPSAQAVHTPSDVGHGRPAAGPGLATQHPSYDDPLAHHVGSEQMVADSPAHLWEPVSGSMPGILGCPRYSKAQEDLLTYVIAQPCVDLKDRACVDECPVDCIYEGKRMLYIHPDECVDCGACEPVCPVEAIFYEDDTPEQWKDYYTANVAFFEDLGSPGGAAKMGVIDKDHALIEALPPQPQE